MSCTRLSRWFGEDLLKRNVIHPIYLVCFCEDDNLLSQWRTYGQSGGYSLGFMLPAPDFVSGLGFKPEPNIYTAKWVRVEYTRAEQVRSCAGLLNLLLPIFDDPDTTQAIQAVGDHPIFGYSETLRVVGDMLLEEIVGFKNEAFKVEKEWRIVVRQRQLLKQGTDDGGSTPIPVYFRSSKGMLSSLRKAYPDRPSQKLPITCVRSGPTLDKATTGMAVSMMLAKNGFSRVQVQGSEIPVRF